MKELVFATNNKNKVAEVEVKLHGAFNIKTLAELGCHDDIPETADSLEGNALQKARFVYERYHCNSFADDTGLEVEALNGAPGVYTARYAGESKDPDANMNKLLTALMNESNRKARFRTIIALIIDGQETLFEGRVDGTIRTEKCGQKGFGYDPIFQPDGYDKTFAELPLEVKNHIGHRGKAVEKLIVYLNNK